MKHTRNNKVNTAQKKKGSHETPPEGNAMEAAGLTHVMRSLHIFPGSRTPLDMTMEMNIAPRGQKRDETRNDKTQEGERRHKQERPKRRKDSSKRDKTQARETHEETTRNDEEETRHARERRAQQQQQKECK